MYGREVEVKSSLLLVVPQHREKRRMGQQIAFDGEEQIPLRPLSPIGHQIAGVEHEIRLIGCDTLHNGPVTFVLCACITKDNKGQ